MSDDAGAVSLKPCPFCGGEAEIDRLGTPRQSTIYACTSCGCRLETGEEWAHGERWNTRATSASTPQQSPSREKVDDREVMRLWRECGLPEYFLGNGGTNDKLVAFAQAARLAPARGAEGVADGHRYTEEVQGALQMIRGADDLSMAQVMAQVALDFFLLDEDALAEGRAFQPSPDPAPDPSVSQKPVDVSSDNNRPVPHADELQWLEAKLSGRAPT